jgi:hypothetical protein
MFDCAAGAVKRRSRHERGSLIGLRLDNDRDPACPCTAMVSEEAPSYKVLFCQQPMNGSQ